VGYFFSDLILQYLLIPIRSLLEKFYFFSPTEAFFIKIKVTLLAGCLLSSPILVSQVWLFIAPGLYKKERYSLIPWIIITSVLFLAGVAFAFYLVIPLALEFLIGFQTEFLTPMISISSYISFLTTILLAFGIAFNLPVFIMVFVISGLVTSQQLGQNRKYAIVATLIGAAILTPPDVISQILLALPLVFLYEATIHAARFVESRRN